MPKPARDGRIVTLGETIRRIRSVNAWTQETLAHRADLHPTLIGQLEHGKDMRLSTVLKLADGFGIPPSELLQRSERGDFSPTTGA